MSMKSIRKTILHCLATGGEQTIDDLLTATGIDRKTLSSNLGPAKSEGLITSRRDDVTLLPAYRITDAGRERLGDYKPEPEEPPRVPSMLSQHVKAVTGEDAAPANEGGMLTDKECGNAARIVATTAGAEVSDLRKEIELRKDCAKADAEKIREQHRQIAALEAELTEARQKIDTLNELLMSEEGAVDVKDAACAYLVTAKNRKPVKLKKPESAVAKAKSAAKAVGRSDVFALVYVGSARASAEFKEAA